MKVPINKTKVSRYIQGMMDARSGCITKNEDGSCNSYALENTTSCANAATLIHWRDKENAITEIEERIRMMKHRVKQIELRSVHDSEEVNVERNKKRIAKLERDIVMSECELEKLIKKGCEEAEAIRLIYEAREVLPYLHGASKYIPGLHYSINVSGQPYYYRNAEDETDFV